MATSAVPRVQGVAPKPASVATNATKTIASGARTRSDSAWAPTHPRPVGSWARNPIATSPATSSVDVTTTWPKACRTRGAQSGVQETSTSFDAPGAIVAAVEGPSTNRTDSRDGERTSSRPPRIAIRKTASGSFPVLLTANVPSSLLGRARARADPRLPRATRARSVPPDRRGRCRARRVNRDRPHRRPDRQHEPCARE